MTWKTIQPSWYKTKYKFDITQQSYIKMLTEGFQMRDAYGEPIPYNMTDYQAEFHAESFNILRGKAKDILFKKSRGISFTTSSAVELIVTAGTFENQIVPIIAQREESAFEILDVVKWLIRNCKIKEILQNAEFTTASSSIRFKNTNSMIKVYPSSSAGDAIRGKRLLRGLVDEFAFQQRDRELWAAIENCFAHGLGQILVGSTMCGRNNMFFELTEKARTNTDMGFKLFELPMFDPTKFDPKIPIQDQKGLVPIAPWINVPKLEIKRRRDWRIFMQEQQCDTIDDSISLIPFASIMRCVEENLRNYKDKFHDIDFTFNTENRVFIGVDVAEVRDYFAVTVFEEIVNENEVKYVQRFLDYFNGKDTPQLEKYLDRILEMFPTTHLMRIDRTGMGTGLAAYMKKGHPYLIEGINFASSIRVEGKEKGKIREIMVTNLKKIVDEVRVVLIPDNLQVAHINSIDYGFKISGNSEGHGDILFSVALALLPSKYTIQSNEYASTTMNAKDEIKRGEEMTLVQKMDWFRRQGGAATTNILPKGKY